jgi:hypothetical protein
MARTRTLARISLWRLLATVILGACAACAHVPQQSESAKRAGIEASNLELSTRTVTLGREFLREIELAGDSIEAGTQDVHIRRSSLQWKLSSVPAVEEAVLREDHVIAMFDLFAFRGQMADFLNSPAGAEAFGAELPLAQRALLRIDPEWAAAAASIGVHMPEASRERFDEWVRTHPIERVPFTRSTIVGEMTLRLRDQESSIGAAVGGMQEALVRLELRISLANEFAVKQAVWLTQLAALEVATSPETSNLSSTLTSTRTLMDETPDLILRERIATLEDVERQRRETIATLREERATVLATLANERAVVLDGVDEQRRRAMRDLDSLRARVADDAIRVVDHLLLRLTVLVAALLVVVGAWSLLMGRRTPA